MNRHSIEIMTEKRGTAYRLQATLAVALILGVGLPLRGQQLNQPGARLTIHGQVASLSDSVGHQVHVPPAGAIDISVHCAGTPGATMMMLVSSTLTLGGTALPWGSLDLGTPTGTGAFPADVIILGSSIGGGVGSPFDPLLFADAGNAASGVDPTMTLTLPGYAGTPLAIQFIVTDSSSPTGFSMTEAAVLVSDPAGYGRTTEQEPGPRSMYVRAGKIDAEASDDNDFGRMDHVRPFSGEAYHQVTDLVIPGRGFDFVWRRTYRSRTGRDTDIGNGWTHSYDIHLVVKESGVIVMDGEGRADFYAPKPDGTWLNPEFARRLALDDDGRYRLTFWDSSQWIFNPTDADAPGAGKIDAIIDRNGNMMGFSYNAQGRLDTVTDTLGRSITMTYDQANRLCGVVDFTSRKIAYTHYAAGDVDGAIGDLASATSPKVVGTPNGNDFPSGKTTTYTYTTGTGVKALDSNLLTVVDGRGQTYLSNTYFSTSNPGHPNFDRLSSHTLGAAGDVFDFVFEAVAPSSANNYAVSRTIVNDRLGHVTELEYDAQNRAVVERRFTGTANPDLPTTSTVNRPTNRLRVNDPVWFETRSEFDGRSQLTRMVRPAQNVMRARFDSAHPNALARGNRQSMKLLPGPRGGDQSEIVESWEYVERGGGFFPSKHTDGRGNATVFDHDAAGNVTKTIARLSSIVTDYERNAHGQITAHIYPDNGTGHRRRDEFTYYTSGSSAGYLEKEIVDVGNFALTTAYEYNAVGRRVKTINPKGGDVQYVVNELDQVVREISPVIDATGVRYHKDYHYDANDNVVRVDVLDVDDAGVVAPDPYVSTLRQYDVLNRGTITSKEVTSGSFLSTERIYDANGNLRLFRYGAAFDGSDPANVVAWDYDERDLRLRKINAPGHAKQSTTTYDHSLNGAPVQVSTGIEAGARVSTWEYDGFDRVRMVTDPMGNSKTVTYDANGNREKVVFMGELVDVPGSAANVRLAEQDVVFDAMDRMSTFEEDHFDPMTQTILSDGHSTRTYTWNGLDQLLLSFDDNNQMEERVYDTAHRMCLLRDADQNTTTFTFDASGNMMSRVETWASDLGAASQSFTMTFSHDGRDRLRVCTDSGGNTRTFDYNSGGKLTREVDGRGIETRFLYDGLGRRTFTIQDMNQNGASASDPADIVHRTGWDASSRLVARFDGNDNFTITQYDPLDRPTCEFHADGTKFIFDWDAHGDLIERIDPNGTKIVSTYDDFGRRTMTTMSPGPGVSSDLLVETYEYDGYSRLVSATDEDAQLDREHDSLHNLLSETLNGETSSHSYDGMGNQLQSVYPGGRTLSRTFDPLGREAVVSQGASLVARYDYIGPEQMERRSHGNGTRVDFSYSGSANPPGDFGYRQTRRIVASLPSLGITYYDFNYTYDGSGNRRTESNLVPGGTQIVYSYDDASRVTQDQTSSSGTTIRTEVYTYDRAYNRLTRTTNGSSANYTLDPTLPDPADFQVNQYTTTPDDQRFYDKNGNLIELIGTGVHRKYEYDAYDQMTTMIDMIAVETWKYLYDPEGRRIAKMKLTTAGDDSGPRLDPGAVALTSGETWFQYYFQQVIEEQDVDGNTTATYVYGTTIDDVVNLQNSNGDFYYHSDDQLNVQFLTDGTGDVAERYTYDYQGVPSVEASKKKPMSPAAASVTAFESAIGNCYLFAGRRYDSESELYYFRYRYMDPSGGSFTTRDQIGGTWGDERNGGNAYAYVGHNYATCLDQCQVLATKTKKEIAAMREKSKEKPKRPKPTPRGPKKPGPGGKGSQRCQKLKDLIDNYCKEIWKRREELREDPTGLRWRKPSAIGRCDRRWHWDELKKFLRLKRDAKPGSVVGDEFNLLDCPRILRPPRTVPVKVPEKKPEPEKKPDTPPEVPDPPFIPVPSLPRIPCPTPEQAAGLTVAAVAGATLYCAWRVARLHPALWWANVLP